MQPLQLIERVYELVESREIDKAVMVCLRLARSANDTFNVVMFLRELSPDIPQLQAALYRETMHLAEEARTRILKATTERWIDERKVTHLSGPDDDDDTRNVLGMGVGELCRDIENMERSIEDLRLPPGLSEYDTAAFMDQHVKLKGQMRL